MLRMCIAFKNNFIAFNWLLINDFVVALGKVERVSIVSSMEDIISSSSFEIVSALVTAKFVVTLPPK